MNQVALITGASRGIGRGIAIQLADAGWDLLLNYAQNQSAAHETSQACLNRAAQHHHSIRVEVFRADVSSASQRLQLLEFARQSFSRLDLLVNNAGMAPRSRADILDASEESFDELIATNLKGPYFLTQLAAKWMIEQQRASPSSLGLKIINISSISAYTASTNRGDYCVSKAGLAMATQLFASRLAEFGIAVFEIRPGLIATDMTQPVKQKYDQLIQTGLTPFPRWGTPEDVGKAVAAIAQGLLPFSTGEIINVDGGFHLRRL